MLPFCRSIPKAGFAFLKDIMRFMSSAARRNNAVFIIESGIETGLPVSEWTCSWCKSERYMFR